MDPGRDARRRRCRHRRPARPHCFPGSLEGGEVVRLRADWDAPGGFAAFRAIFGGFLLFGHLAVLLAIFMQEQAGMASVIGTSFAMGAAWIGAALGRVVTMLADHQGHQTRTGFTPSRRCSSWPWGWRFGSMARASPLVIVLLRECKPSSTPRLLQTRGGMFRNRQDKSLSWTTSGSRISWRAVTPCRWLGSNAIRPISHSLAILLTPHRYFCGGGDGWRGVSQPTFFAVWPKRIFLASSSMLGAVRYLGPSS